jgi:hypothetical protein
MRLSVRPFLVALLAVAVVSHTASAAAVKFTSTWTAPEARSVNFRGQKVAALVISEDLSLRMSAEEALARELSARAMQGVAAYRMIPPEELKNPERAKAWFARDEVAGAVVLRPVSQQQVPRYSPDIWATANYSTLWGFYPYGWTTVYVAGSSATDTVIVVESLVYQVTTGKLLWAGVSETTNPKTLQRLVGDIVKDAAERIQKQLR